MSDFPHHKSFKQCALFIAIFNFRINLVVEMVNHNTCVLDSTSIYNEMNILKNTQTYDDITSTRKNEEVEIH